MSLRLIRRFGVLALAAALGLTTAATAAPTRQANATGAYTIVLDRLVCYDTEDWGADEPYLTVDGSTVWGPGSINNGQTADVNVTRTFSGSITINLYEDDWPDADDYISSIIVYEGAAGLGEQSLSFINAGNGSHYTLYFHVY